MEKAYADDLAKMQYIQLKANDKDDIQAISKDFNFDFNGLKKRIRKQ